MQRINYSDNIKILLKEIIQIKNFYPKWKELIILIINESMDIIKRNYSNQEIFSIFHHNEPLILFLSKENIFQFDDIKYLIINRHHQEQS